jgi:hypothetical protein
MSGSVSSDPKLEHPRPARGVDGFGFSMILCDHRNCKENHRKSGSQAVSCGWSVYATRKIHLLVEHEKTFA